MSKHRLSFLALSSFLFVFTANVAIARTPDPCTQLRRDHGRQMQDLKQQQGDALQQCEAADGGNSQGCVDLRERQKEEMRQLLERQRASLTGCNRGFFAFDSEVSHYYHQSYYRNTNYAPGYPKRPYHDHDGDGDHHHHHHDHDGDHHHRYQGEPGHAHVASAVSSASRHESGAHSGTVSAAAIHSQWTHSQNSGSGWSGGGGGGSSSYNGGYSGHSSSGGSGGYGGGHSSGGGYSGGGGGGGGSVSHSGGGGGYSGGGSSGSSGGGGGGAGGGGGSHGVVK